MFPTRFSVLSSLSSSLCRSFSLLSLSRSSPSLHSNSLSSSLFLIPHRLANKKAGGSSKNSNDSAGRRLGLKVGNQELVKTGMILMRQRGHQTHPGVNVGSGRDHTLFALKPGRVCFTYTLNANKRSGKLRKYINVIHEEGGQTLESVEAHFKEVQKRLDTVLQLRKEGKKLPSSRELYERKVKAEKKRADKEKYEQLLAKLDIPNKFALGGPSMLDSAPKSIILEEGKKEKQKSQ